MRMGRARRSEMVPVLIGERDHSVKAEIVPKPKRGRGLNFWGCALGLGICFIPRMDLNREMWVIFIRSLKSEKFEARYQGGKTKERSVRMVLGFVCFGMNDHVTFLDRRSDEINESRNSEPSRIRE